MTTQQFHDLALSFPGAEDHPHFGRTAYKVAGKRIFSSLHEESQSANVKLPLADQGVFCDFDAKIVYPVPNKFGLQGWTTFDLTKVPREFLAEALYSAYKESLKTTPKKK